MSFKKPNIGFSYLLALAVVAFSRFAWLPWIVIYLHQRKYNSWAATVFGYGLLLTCFHAGQYIGHALTKSKSMNSSWFTISFMTLTGSFISLCFITRYTLMLGIFTVMGMSGMILSGVSINIDTNTPQLAILKRASELEINDSLERNLVSFAFVILVAGFLYNSDPLAQFPVYHIAIALALFCILVFAYYIIISRMIKKRAPGMGGSGMSGEDSSEGRSTPSVVVNYTGPVPENFYTWCSKDISKARGMYGKMLQWRQEKNVDNIFDTPQDHFYAILKNYPHAIHGYSLDGCGVIYELLGRGNMAGIKAAGVTIDQVVWHMELRNELVFQRLLEPDYMRAQGAEPNLRVADPTNPDLLSAPVRKMITILDVGGIGLYSVNIDVLTFIMKSGEIIDNYYPQQVSRLVVVNAPSFFSLIFKVIAKGLPASVRDKVDILHDMKDLDKYIHPSQRPAAYGGTGVELGKAQGHLDFLALEERWRTSGGVPPPPPPAPVPPAPLTIEPATKPAAGEPSPSINKRGLLGWFQRPQTAFLGEENTYKYNPLTRTWDEDVAVTNEPAINLSATTAPNRKGPREDHKAHRRGGRGGERGGDTSDEYNSSDELIPKGNNKNNTRKKKDKHSDAKMSHDKLEKSRRDQILKEKVEEHGMVVAINMAHHAKARSSSQHRSMNSLANLEEGGGSSMNLSDMHRSRSYHESEFRAIDNDDDPNHPYRMQSHDDGDNSSSERTPRENAFVPAKLSPKLFLIVLSMYCTCLWVAVALFTLVPVWLVIPVSAGGMEYTVREVSLVLSSAAMWSLLGHKALSYRTDHMLKTSPIRALRLGCGLLVGILLLLPYLMEMTVPNNDPVDLSDVDTSALSAAAMEDMHAQDHRVQFVTIFGRSLHSQAPVSYSTFASADHHNVAYDYVHWASSKYTFQPRSILALQLPALLFSFMLCGLQLCRRASGIAMQLTLANTFHDPTSVRRALNGLVEIGGPTLAACLFSLGYGMGLKYPLDASSFFHIGACQIMLVYIASILLKVQFRGDYGVMADYEEATGGSAPSNLSSHRSVFAQDNPHEIMLGEESPSTPGAYQRHNGLRRTSSLSPAEFAHQEAPSRLSAAAKVFSIPLGDLSLLYSPVFSAYGSKLYNLKDDFKDV